MHSEQPEQYTLFPAVQADKPDKKTELMATMKAMPQPTAEQVQTDKQAAADGTYKRTDAAQQEESPAHAVGKTCGDFLSMTFPPKRQLLGPVLQERDLAMLFAGRGTGKTLFTMQMAVAEAGGGTFLKWQAENPQRVLYVDGEMPGALMQYRVKKAREWAIGAETTLVDKNLAIITPDIQPGAMLNLTKPEGQAWLLPWVEWADIVILDSLLTLAPYGKSNDAESALPLQGYLLQLRQKGKTVLVVHHAGKGGDQLGTINKETVLDTVFKLTPVDMWEQTADAQFKLSFTKNRNFWGVDANPLLVSLQDGVWTYKDGLVSMVEAVRERVELGLTQTEIAKELKCNQSTVSRIVRDNEIKKPTKNARPPKAK